MRASSERLSMSSKHGENCNARVRSLMTSMSADPISSTSNSWSSRMKSRRRLERRSLNWSRSMAVSMARNTSGPRMSAKASLRSLASQSSSSLLAVCWLMSRASVSLSRSSLAFLNEQAGELAAQLGGNPFNASRSDIVPALRVGRLEGLERPAMFGGGKLLQQRAELASGDPDRRWR